MKKRFNKMILTVLLSMCIFPINVYANENNGIEKEFTIDVAQEENTLEKENSYIVYVIKDKEQKQNIIVNGITKEDMKEILDEYNKKNKETHPLASLQSNAKGTVIENVGVDNKEYPIRREIVRGEVKTKDANGNAITNSQFKERPSSDARQFLTFTTKSGKVFHLIINHDKGENNVQLLTEVSEADLLNLIENKQENKIIEKEIKQEEVKIEKVKEEPKKENNYGSYFILGIVLIGVLGAGYYFKIVKPKQEEHFEFDEENDDEFFVDNEEITKENEDEEI